jgi:acyl dehydratase
MGFGRYFEEFEPGELFRHWPGRTISEADNTWFSLLTMNQHPLHIDSHYAAGTQHGRPLVVGTLVFSIAVGISVADISGRAIANLEYEEIRHTAPVFHGDTIYAETRVLDKVASRSKPDRGIVHVETRVFNQRDETVMTFRRRVLVPRHSEPAQ